MTELTSPADDYPSHLHSTQIDHVVILLSPKDFVNLPSWLSNNFTIVDGGTHSQGTSRNKLIIFEDGSYLELFSWVEPPPTSVEPYADFPGWANKPINMIIDWALTGEDAHGKYDEVTSRLKELLSQGEQLNVTYDQPAAGGRRRQDGQELRWVTTRPRRLNTLLDTTSPNVPFFCHDISPRVFRVPYAKGAMDGWPGIITHPCGATGIDSITIETPPQQLESMAKLYEAILGTNPSDLKAAHPGVFEFQVVTPRQAWQSSVDWLDKQGRTHASSDPGEERSNGAPCVVRLQKTSTQASGCGYTTTGIQRLALTTNREERRGEKLSRGDFHTPVVLS